MPRFPFLFVFLALAAAPLPALADPPSVPSEKRLGDLYFSGPNPTLTPQERAGTAIAKRWKNPITPQSMPVAGADGTIRFLYGAQQPGIVCAVLQVCDVELQPGEQVNSLHLGDTARWSVDPAITGTGDSEVQHLIIKPQDVGLDTSLVVATNRRTYHLRLRSHRSEYMPRVAFTYPDESNAKWDALKTREARQQQDRERAATQATTGGEYLGNLSFAYDVAGTAAWKPVRVYNDGSKTIIQMPAAMVQTEAPTLLVIRKDGGIFKDPDTVMVNYRVQGDRYVVDTVFDQAILIAGVGKDQDRVTITKEK